MPGAIENSLHEKDSQDLLVAQFMEQAMRATEGGDYVSKAERLVYARDFLLNQQMAMATAAFKLDQEADEAHEEEMAKRLSSPSGP